LGDPLGAAILAGLPDTPATNQQSYQQNLWEFHFGQMKKIDFSSAPAARRIESSRSARQQFVCRN
jgi:hypothetical protein